MSLDNSTYIAGQKLFQIASSNEVGPRLFEQISSLIISECFLPDSASLYAHLRSSLPDMMARLKLQGASLKIALEAAISKANLSPRDLRRGSEKYRNQTRQVFEAALIALLFVQIVRGDEAIQHLLPEGFSLFTSYEQVHLAFQHQIVKRVYPYSDYTVDELERIKLLYFANIARVCLLLMPLPKKAIMLELATHLSEGSGIKYVTGNGQTAFVSRRVAIFEVATGLQPVGRRRLSKAKPSSGSRTSGARRSNGKKPASTRRRRRYDDSSDDEEDDEDYFDEEEDGRDCDDGDNTTNDQTSDDGEGTFNSPMIMLPVGMDPSGNCFGSTAYNHALPPLNYPFSLIEDCGEEDKVWMSPEEFGGQPQGPVQAEHPQVPVTLVDSSAPVKLSGTKRAFSVGENLSWFNAAVDDNAWGEYIAHNGACPDEAFQILSLGSGIDDSHQPLKIQAVGDASVNTNPNFGVNWTDEWLSFTPSTVAGTSNV